MNKTKKINKRKTNDFSLFIHVKLRKRREKNGLFVFLGPFDDLFVKLGPLNFFFWNRDKSSWGKTTLKVKSLSSKPVSFFILFKNKVVRHLHGMWKSEVEVVLAADDFTFRWRVLHHQTTLLQHVARGSMARVLHQQLPVVPRDWLRVREAGVLHHARVELLQQHRGVIHDVLHGVL